MLNNHHSQVRLGGSDGASFSLSGGGGVGVSKADGGGVGVLPAVPGEGEGVLPSIYLKSGELKKTARALDAGQFTALIAHAREVAAGLADRLYGGETAVSPTRDTSRAACDFCEYHAICHFDAASPDAPFRELPQMSMEELRQALSPGQVEEGTHKKQ